MLCRGFPFLEAMVVRKRSSGSTGSRRLLFILVTLVGLALFTEVAARLAFRLQRPRAAPPLLDAYEVADPETRGLWRLRAGFSQTMDELIATKEAEGRSLAVRHYNATRERLDIPGSRRVLTINRSGYRGPELAEPRRSPRLLTLGDSCTFGTIEEYTYPRVVEREIGRTRPVEVINAGVEGYGPRQILQRIDEFRELEPELTLLYIGWNALWGERPPGLARAGSGGKSSSRPSPFYSVRLLSKLADSLMPRRAALSAYGKEKRPDPDDPALELLESWRPSFIDDVATIVDEMQRSGSRVVLVTLPGLYTVDGQPSPRALEIGHLPAFTDNPYVLARMTERYNHALRSIADERDLGLIDLDLWSREAFPDRDGMFIDSVHLIEEAQEALGRYLAGELRPLLPGSGEATSRETTEVAPGADRG
jgi:lysophospholipase L1-like esterase